jgi:lysozyme
MSDPRKLAFDAARGADDDRALNANEVRIVHAALDAVGWPRAAAMTATTRRIGPDGVALIKRFEGCHRVRPDGRIEAYPDPGPTGLPVTIGWGTTRIDGRPITLGTTITQARADELLEKDLEKYADEVNRALGNTPTSQQQFDALVSFHYNTGAIGRATLTKKHVAGDFVGALGEFKKWNKAGGKVMKGLTNRRAAEAELYGRGS